MQADFESTILKLTPTQANLRAQKYCAYQERCQQEVRDKLYLWGLKPDDVEDIISTLIQGNFINEERFARTFAGGKFRIKKWGRVKIKIELKKRKISDFCIRKAMSEIEEKAYLKTIRKIIADRSKKIKGRNIFQKNHSLAQYVISKGFETDLVWDLINRE